MNKKRKNESPTPEQMKSFTDYYKAITGERLAILNHAKLHFSESADKLKEAQEMYNNSLLFTYNDYSRLPENKKSITLNEELMNDVFNKMSAPQIEVDIDFLKSNITKLTKAIIFLNAHTFDIELSTAERLELNDHMTTLSDYRITLLSAFENNSHHPVDIMQDDKAKLPTIMHSTLDDLLLIMYEFLTRIDNWQQVIEAIQDEELANELEEAYIWLDEKIVFYRRRNTEISASERNEIRSHIKHYTELATDRLGEGL
jgi:hypothetical protein